MSLIILPVAAPLLVSPALFWKKGRRYCLVTLIAGMVLLAVNLASGPEWRSASYLTSLEEIGLAPLYFTVHPYGKIAAFGFLLVGPMALLYGLAALKPSEQAVSLWALAAALGIVLAGNFLTLYFFWEMLTLSAAGLILLKRDQKALQMGFRFMVFQLAGGLSLLMGILQHYSASGSLALCAPAAGLPLFILGIGIKTAFIPLHLWLPWGYPAASFSSSVLLSALSTKIGVYAVARILPAHNAVALMGAVMAVYGVFCAIRQTELRRLLSYHIISQVGYMVAGVGLGAALSVDGGMLHLVNHMIYKALLFMCAGALIYAAGTEDLHALRGRGEAGEKPVWRALPVAALGALAGALAIAGMPPFNGYASKYLLKYAVSGIEPVAWMLLLAGVGTALSFSKFVYFGFIRSRARIRRKLPGGMAAAIIVLAAATLLLGIRPSLLGPLLPYGSSLAVYSPRGIAAALQPIAIGIALFALAARLLDPSREHKKTAFPAPAWLHLPPGGAALKGGLKTAMARLEEASKLQVQLIFAFVLTLSLTYLFMSLRILK